MKSNDTKTAFSVHHNRIVIGLRNVVKRQVINLQETGMNRVFHEIDDLIVVLDMCSKPVFCSKVADHSRDMRD